MIEDDVYRARDVFTPSTPARTCFVEREEINGKLVRALETPGRQVVVYGHSGSGKTTLLLNKLHQLYEFHITTRCMKGMTFDQIVLDAFDQLSPFYVSETVSQDKKNWNLSIAADYAGIKLQITNQLAMSEKSKVEKRYLPPQLTASSLGMFIGQAKACWVIEDFHKIDALEKPKLSQMMKVFMDMADGYPDLKIIALGATNTAREVVEYDSEMRNRVAEIFVPLMTPQEVVSIIVKGEAALNIEIPTEIKDAIVKYSNGLASPCHHLCLNMCHVANISETIAGKVGVLDYQNFEFAIKAYLEDSSDSVKGCFDRALKRKRANEFDARHVANALSSFKEDGAARFDILKKIKNQNQICADPVLKRKLVSLCMEENGSLLRYDEVSGKYSFADPLYKVYASAYSHSINQNSGGGQSPTPSLEEIKNLLIKLLNAIPKNHMPIGGGNRVPAESGA